MYLDNDDIDDSDDSDDSDGSDVTLYSFSTTNFETGGSLLGTCIS